MIALWKSNKKKNMKKVILKIVNVVIVVGFGIFLVWFLLNQIDIGDIKKAFLNLYMPSLIIGLILMLVNDYFRAYRKNLLIGSSRVGMGDMFLVAMIRNAFNKSLFILFKIIIKA